MNQLHHRVVAGGAVALSALAIVGCGGSGSTAGHRAKTITVIAAADRAPAAERAPAAASKRHEHDAAPDRPARSRPVRPERKVAPAHAGAAPKITRGNRTHRPAPGTGGKAINDDNPAGKASEADSGHLGPANPCLVSRSQAERFTGTGVAAPKVAPLGPTCVYTAKGGQVVTLAVEQTVFAKLKPHIHKLTGYRIGGTRAYCGIYGAPATYALLPRDRVLVVSAPCDVGKRFATAALSKLVRAASVTG
jgi:hypothetical protein